MADAPQMGKSRGARLAETVGKFGAAWMLVELVTRTSAPHRAFDWCIDALYRILAGFPAAAYLVEQFFRQSVDTLAVAFFVTLFFATGLAPLGAAARIAARARVRAGQRDFLDVPREAMKAHPRLANALLALPGLFFAWLALKPGRYELEHPSIILFGIPSAALAAWGMFAASRKGVRVLTAPTLEGEAPSTMTISPDEIVFDAVAVTRESKAMVGLIANLSVAMVALIASRPLASLFHDRWLFAVMAAYIAITVTAAVVFQKASRVAVGVDGVHVRGTSRAKFHAYRDLDEARVTRGDLELVKRGKVVVRLQLHGQDAVRRDAVLARITENIARVKEGRGATAAQLVASASKEALARVAHGGADYRMAALTREQLWALVEGPEIEASARKAAAEALAGGSGEDDKARLRVAAEHCAEPSVRIALEEIAREEPAAGEGMRRAAT